MFLQGLVPDFGLGTFAAGDLRVASIPQNEYPFAVGVMEASSADIAKTGLKGKGLKLLHHFPDMLWALGDKSTPDSSFTPSRVFPQVRIHVAFLACCFSQQNAEVTSHSSQWSCKYHQNCYQRCCVQCPLWDAHSTRPPSQTPHCLHVGIPGNRGC